MARETILWFTLPNNTVAGDEHLMAVLGRRFAIRVVHTPSAIASALSSGKATALFFDLDVPVRNDLILISQIKRAHPSTPIFMLSRLLSKELPVWAFRAGVRDFFAKPAEPELVLKKVEACSAFLKKKEERRGAKVSPVQSFLIDITRTAKSIRQPLQAVLRLVEENYNRKISLADAADLVSMNQFQLCRMLKKETGLSFKEYLIEFRLECAEALLLRSSAPITEIAWSSGFGDLSNFQRLFRKKNGLSPREYRKKQQTVNSFLIQESPLFHSKKSETEA